MAVLGLTPDDVRSPNIDETPLPRELPRDYCRRITASKAAVLPAAPDEVVLCADTTVALGRRIMGKPSGADEARKFLQLLSGRRHRVITAVAVRTAEKTQIKDVVSAVKMKSLSPAEIDGYIATNDWQGKAGGYGIQGPAGAFIPWISGSYPAIMGLPLTETAGLLTNAGINIWSAP